MGHPWQRKSCITLASLAVPCSLQASEAVKRLPALRASRTCAATVPARGVAEVPLGFNSFPGPCVGYFFFMTAPLRLTGDAFCLPAVNIF